MISICTPTRNRPESFKKFCESIWNTVSDKNNVEISIYRDDDDNSEYEYSGNYKLIKGKRIFPDAAYNECQKVATGPIYIFSPDDMLFLTPGWDKAMEDAFNKSRDKIIFVHLNDDYARSNYGIVGGIHKNWVDTVGYFFNPTMCRGGDVVINRISKALGRRVMLRKAHIKDTKMLTDKTHTEYMDLINKNKDHLWNSKEIIAEEARAIKKLQDFIDTYK
ncbi:MAG: hypothetical protein Q7K55_03130 [Candidatus Levybacteria bacterium]|nr:hypothetical protein [Candidatus Levybacteria bacterium]